MKDILLTIIFIISLIMFPLSGIDKINGFDKSRSRLVKNLPIDISTDVASLLIVGAIVLQLAAPAMVMYSLLVKESNVWIGLTGVGLLAIFTIIATLVFYMPPTGTKYYGFLGNLTTLGCMLLIGHELYYH